jgi:TPR repeat protein
MNAELSELVAKAETGSAEAQYALGALLYNGEECARDSAAAFKWLMRAAEQEHAKAQEMVGDCFQAGFGVTRDYDEAFKWYQKSSNQGNSSALFSLGFCYESGLGTAANPVEALGCFKRAAELGNISALHHVVTYYIETVKDYALATEWLGRVRAIFPSSYTDREFEAVGWTSDFYRLGDILIRGIEEPDASGNVINKDYLKAYWIYRIGANAKDVMCIFALLTFKIRTGCEYVSPQQAAMLAMRGAALGCSYSARFLGDAFSDGRGVPKSAAEAVNWWMKAAYQADYEAQFNLGIAYKDGLGVPRDLIEAYVWINLSAAGAPPHVSKCKEARDLLEVSLAPDLLVSAQKRSTEIHATLKKS